MTSLDTLTWVLGLGFGIPLFILLADAVEKRVVEHVASRRFAEVLDAQLTPAALLQAIDAEQAKRGGRRG